jgi:tRNA isopentenyl-2-thiomethyl-A-37 hydroxylase MiaE
MTMRKRFLCFIFAWLALPAAAVTVDRIAAVVDNQVLTVSEVGQMVELRFGAQDIAHDAIEARMVEIQRRFASPAEFDAAALRTELTPDEIRALVKRQLQVEAYIQERFAPLVFVTNEDVATYYAGPWTAQRRTRGLAVPPHAQVRDEVTAAVRASRLQEEIEKWTGQLRARANVDIYAWR